MPSHSRSTRLSDTSSSSRTIVATSLLYKPTGSTPIEVITLQYDDAPVFVKRPETFQEAVDTAKKEYHQLAHLPVHRIGFALSDMTRGSRFVRISESAWVPITAKIPGGTIINVLVLPDPDDEKCPPQYGSLLDVPTLPHKDGRYLGVRRVASSASMQPSSKTGHGLLSWMGVGK